jgi:4-amino-4-deoxy-L-arabinose transferase-like glycosyltransferase
MRSGRLIIFIPLVAVLAVLSIAYPEVGPAAVVTGVLSVGAIAVFRNYSTDKGFVTRLFLGALAVRLAFGLIVYVYDLKEFFGADAITYDFNGSKIVDYWFGNTLPNDVALNRAISTSSPGWGMNYLVATLYLIFGRNILLAQSFCAVFGAATAVVVYICTLKIYPVLRVAKFAAFAVAFFPSFIIWSSQLMKDGLIIFLLVLTITMVLQLQERFSYASIALLVFSLFGILSLRFYIFYMVAIAVAGSFVVGLSNTRVSLLRRAGVLVILGVSLTYLGVIRNASENLENYGTLERIQLSRLDQSRTESGFNEDVDVSTTEGAISAVPVGLAYLMLAPFPWQVTNFRQAITLPEVLIWWAMIPLMISGLWYTLKNRLRTAFPILFFSLMLTLAYSIFQGNVGTAYRQRTQIQVFLFIFIAVGWSLWKEKRDDRKMERLIKQKKFDDRLRGDDDDDHRGYP